MTTRTITLKTDSDKLFDTIINGRGNKHDLGDMLVDLLFSDVRRRLIALSLYGIEVVPEPKS